MHTLLFVVIPDGVMDIAGYVRDRMQPHRRRDDVRGGQWDGYLFGGRWDGEVRPEGVRAREAGSLENNISPIATLTRACGAILTPDGVWHDLSQFAFRAPDSSETEAAAMAAWDRHARELLAAYPDGAVVAIDAHR